MTAPKVCLATIALVSLVLVACDGDSTDSTSTNPGGTTPTSSAETTETIVDSAVTTATTCPLRSDPSEGWRRLDVDTRVFAGVRPVDGAGSGGSFVLVGCPSDDVGLFPIWWASEGFEFEQAMGPETDRPRDVRCIQEVAPTTFGWFAGGLGPLLRSEDGVRWEIVDLPALLGYEETFQLGYADNLFVSPDGDRLTVLYRRAAMNESTIATLVTTTDGVTWVENAHPSQSLFDSSGIAAVVDGADGLLAVGSSPGGEFVPTAAAFTSSDGLRWRRVTPRGDSDFDEAVIGDVLQIGDRYIAVGSDFFRTGLMTAWSSPDGIDWRRLPSPPEMTDPAVAYMTGHALTVADGFIWVSGQDFDARRNDPQSLPAIWRSSDGQAWERIPVDQLEINVPFEVASTPDLRIGIWPPPGSAIDEPLILFGSD